jgi:hypothetical protein
MIATGEKPTKAKYLWQYLWRSRAASEKEREG